MSAVFVSLEVMLASSTLCAEPGRCVSHSEHAGILGGRGRPLTGGVLVAEVGARIDRELLGGDAAGVHLQERALLWLGAAVDASSDDRELGWHPSRSTSDVIVDR